MDTHYIKPEDMPEGPIPQDVLEKHFAEHPTIFDLQMDITQACTERCIHCYIPERHKNTVFGRMLKNLQNLLQNFHF